MASWLSTRDPKGPMKRAISILNKQKIQSQDADGLPESKLRFKCVWSTGEEMSFWACYKFTAEDILSENWEIAG